MGGCSGHDENSPVNITLTPPSLKLRRAGSTTLFPVRRKGGVASLKIEATIASTMSVVFVPSFREGRDPCKTPELAFSGRDECYYVLMVNWVYLNLDYISPNQYPAIYTL